MDYFFIGKRLRHELKRPIKIDRGGPSDYQLLTTYTLQHPPRPNEPKIEDSYFAP